MVMENYWGYDVWKPFWTVSATTSNTSVGILNVLMASKSCIFKLEVGSSPYKVGSKQH